LHDKENIKMPTMRYSVSFSETEELVWAQCFVFFADKTIFLRPVPGRPLRADHQRADEGL
jgi:hypothetical protein